MNKYIVKLNIPYEEIIETRFKEADIFVSHNVKLDDYLIFVETNHNMERIFGFDWVEEVRSPRKYSLNI